jgi:hypothetical protein
MPLTTQIVIDGRTVVVAEFDLSQDQGKVALIGFLGIWCGASIEELSNSEVDHDRGFEVVGIAEDTELSAAT